MRSPALARAGWPPSNLTTFVSWHRTTFALRHLRPQLCQQPLHRLQLPVDVGHKLDELGQRRLGAGSGHRQRHAASRDRSAWPSRLPAAEPALEPAPASGSVVSRSSSRLGASTFHRQAPTEFGVTLMSCRRSTSPRSHRRRSALPTDSLLNRLRSSAFGKVSPNRRTAASVSASVSTAPGYAARSSSLSSARSAPRLPYRLWART